MEELGEEIKGQCNETNNILSIASQILNHMECVENFLK